MVLPMIGGSNLEMAFWMELGNAGVSNGTISSNPTKAAMAPAAWRMIKPSPTANSPNMVK